MMLTVVVVATVSKLLARPAQLMSTPFRLFSTEFIVNVDTRGRPGPEILKKIKQSRIHNDL